MNGNNASGITQVPETIRAVSGLAGADNRELDPKAVPFTPGQIVQQKSPSETCAREPSVKVAPEKDTNITVSYARGHFNLCGFLGLVVLLPYHLLGNLSFDNPTKRRK